jgi:N-acetylmuramic acid 6-phosphate (MurNAc-6-P) etherase
MQTAAEIRRGNVKNSRSVNLDHFKIKFERRAVGVVPAIQKTKMTKARWKMSVGLGKRGKKDGRD